MARTLLINHVYHPSVGHVVEALKYAKGYVEANQDVEVFLLLNAAAPVELVDGFSWVCGTFPISVSDVAINGANAMSLRRVPRRWDFVITDYRVKNLSDARDPPALVRAQAILQRVLKGRTEASTHRLRGPSEPLEAHPLPYRLNARIDLSIPESARRQAEGRVSGARRICILPGGSERLQNPSVEAWSSICAALHLAFSDLELYFTGVTRSTGAGTVTSGFSRRAISKLVKRCGPAENCFDIGLWNQIALIEQCDLLLSPHTGFAFLAATVGTPWLTLSGCRWPEYLFNFVKFYSVLPECGSYPALFATRSGCGWRLTHRRKALCMTDKLLEQKIPEIVYGAGLLMDKSFGYTEALKLHLEKLLSSPTLNPDDFFFFGGIEGITDTRATAPVG